MSPPVVNINSAHAGFAGWQLYGDQSETATDGSRPNRNVGSAAFLHNIRRFCSRFVDAGGIRTKNRIGPHPGAKEDAMDDA